MANIPRDYQEECLRALFEYFKHAKGNPLVGLPTGTGKSLVIAEFVKRALAMYSKQKFLVATHVKELIQQNYDEFLEQWPTAPAGIYSAGIGKKDVFSKVIFCGIASIIKNIEAFGRVDIFLIDECHLLNDNDETMYMRAINALREVNPKMKVIGFTATPWREGLGLLTEGKLFTDFAINLTDMVSFNRFIKEGYLVPLVSKPTQTALDVNGVHVRMGEFKADELEAAVNKDSVTWAALQEAVMYGRERRSWLVFASGLKHAEKIRQMLEMLNVSCRVVHSKMGKKERDKNIEDFKNLEYQAIINMGVLTTGFNHKAIDFIVMLRPTMSSKLWVQMLGRGTRPLFAPGFDINTLEGRLEAIAASPKQNCMVMDFAYNIKRLGPINDPVIPKKKGEAKGEIPIKTCDHCGNYNHISARYCGGEPYPTNQGCGQEFVFQIKFKQTASTEALIKDAEEPIIESFPVDRVTMKEYKKTGKPPSIWVTYYCGFQKFNEFIFPELPGWGRRKAEAWWRKRTQTPMPATTADCLVLNDQLDVPTHIKVYLNKKPYPEVIAETFIGAWEERIVGNDVPF